MFVNDVEDIYDSTAINRESCRAFGQLIDTAVNKTLIKTLSCPGPESTQTGAAEPIRDTVDLYANKPFVHRPGIIHFALDCVFTDSRTCHHSL